LPVCFAEFDPAGPVLRHDRPAPPGPVRLRVRPVIRLDLEGQFRPAEPEELVAPPVPPEGRRSATPVPAAEPLAVADHQPQGHEEAPPLLVRPLPDWER